MSRKRDLYRAMPIHDLESRFNALMVNWLVGEHMADAEWCELQQLQLEKSRRFRKGLVGTCTCEVCSAWIAWRAELHEGRPSGV